MNILFSLAILPVVLLCYYIYAKDINKEPGNVLSKLFFMGALIVIPVLIVEIFLDHFLSTENVNNFIVVFINVLLSVAIVEEGFKWLVVRNVGYDNREFDEVYDIIVYSVFASLGFACIENIFYVYQYGAGNALLRALTAIPGHTCFGVVMGYFMAKAKVAGISGNNKVVVSSMLLSLLVPTILHTVYDSILIFYSNINGGLELFLAFLLFHIVMVVFCFNIVKRMSSVQENINLGIKKGTIAMVEGQVQVETPTVNNVKYCPVCGKYVEGSNYCSGCGFKVK